MRIRIERATSVTPDALYAWWTDFRDGVDDHAFATRRGKPPEGVGRLVLRRGADSCEIEDRGSFLGMPLLERYTVRLRPQAREVALHGANNFSRFAATYRFEEGRAVLEAFVAPIGLLAVLDPVLRPLVRSFLGRDLAGHLEDAERDLAAR